MRKISGRLGGISVMALALLTTTACSASGYSPPPADEVFTGKAAELAEAACDLDAGETLPEGFDSKVANESGGFADVTVLEHVITCNNPDGVRAILELGGDPNHLNKEGHTPVAFAAAADNEVLLSVLSKGIDKELKTGTAGERALRNAVMVRLKKDIDDGDWSNLRTLFEYGFDPNARAIDGAPLTAPVVTALSIGRPKGVMIFLENGYSYNLERLGLSVYTRAFPDDSPLWDERERLIDMLKERGVDFDKISKEHNSRQEELGFPTFEAPDDRYTQ